MASTAVISAVVRPLLLAMSGENLNETQASLLQCLLLLPFLKLKHNDSCILQQLFMGSSYPNLFIVKAIGALVPCKLEQVN